MLKRIAASVLLIVTLTLSVVATSYDSNKERWYTQNRVVVHALGQIDGRIETNSREAFLSGVEKGIKVFEADFTFTSDGVMVVRHDFEQMSYYNLEQTPVKDKNGSIVMNSADYSKSAICYKYTPLTALQLLELLEEYPDIWLVTDTKSKTRAEIQRDFKYLVKTAKEAGLESVLDRLIVQIYSEDMLKTVKDIYPFKEWIFTLYQIAIPNHSKIIAFCIQNGIKVVTIAKERNSYVVNAKYKMAGINTYYHTLNRLTDVKALLASGAYGVYSDILTNDDIKFITK